LPDSRIGGAKREVHTDTERTLRPITERRLHVIDRNVEKERGQFGSLPQALRYIKEVIGVD
jgi:hypothetical protein